MKLCSYGFGVAIALLVGGCLARTENSEVSKVARGDESPSCIVHLAPEASLEIERGDKRLDCVWTLTNVTDGIIWVVGDQHLPMPMLYLGGHLVLVHGDIWLGSNLRLRGYNPPGNEVVEYAAIQPGGKLAGRLSLVDPVNVNNLGPSPYEAPIGKGELVTKAIPSIQLAFQYWHQSPAKDSGGLFGDDVHPRQEDFDMARSLIDAKSRAVFVGDDVLASYVAVSQTIHLDRPLSLSEPVRLEVDPLAVLEE